MKLMKYSLGLLIGMVVFVTSCTDFVDPRIPYSTFDTGAYLRTVARTSVSFNFFDLSNSRFDITIEGVDAENGATVQTVEVSVRKRRLVPGVGLEYVPLAGPGGAVNDVLIKTIQASDFAQTPDSKFLRTQIVVTAAEAISALGLTNAQVEGGDTFEFRLKLTDNKGRVFNDVNASPDVRGGIFYSSPFFYNVNVVCPSDLGGTFQFSQTDMSSPFGSCPGTITGTVTLTPVPNTTSYTVSDATFGFWACYGDTFTGTGVRMSDACGVLSMSGADKYGDTYSMTFISNDGTNLVFTWLNTSNETGRVTLIANPGKPWPPGLR